MTYLHRKTKLHMKNFLLLIVFSVSFSFSFAQVDLTNGLVAYYPFNGNANDASGYGNNPIFNNATLTSDQLGNPNSAYHFNGVNTYMQIPNSPSLNMTNEISIALWVKPTGFYTGQCYNNMMLVKADGDYFPGEYHMRFSDVYNGCTTPSVDSERFYSTGVIANQPYVQLNHWYSVIWTYNGTTSRLYIDCVLQGEATINLAPLTNSYDLFIGRLNDPLFPYWLNGDLDDIRIYNRALTSDEISTLCVAASALPVKLTNFQTDVVNQQIKLNWTLEEIEGIQNFTIERSENGRDFKTVGTVNSRNIKSYSYTDLSAVSNRKYYYRLGLHSANGSVTYSAIRTAKITGQNNITIITSNPTNGNVIVKFADFTGLAKFTFINSVGQVVQQSKSLISSNGQVNLYLKDHSKGIYSLTIEADAQTVTKRIIIL